MSRRVGLTAAYSGASLPAISSMLSDPSRRGEGSSALEPMARFLDVDHVVAIVPEGNQLRVIVAPPAAGRTRLGPTVETGTLSSTVFEQLRPTVVLGSEPSHPWYAKPGTWLVTAGLIAGVVGGVLIYDATKSGPTGTITVRSPQ